MLTFARWAGVMLVTLAAFAATGYAVLVIWDRTHRPELPPQMRADVWNGGHVAPARDRGEEHGARARLTPPNHSGGSS